MKKEPIEKINAVVLFFDEEGEASKIMSLSDCVISADDFGQQYMPRKLEYLDVYLRVSPIGIGGKATLNHFFLLRKKDLAGNFVETKKQFKDREQSFFLKLLKKRGRI